MVSAEVTHRPFSLFLGMRLFASLLPLLLLSGCGSSESVVVERGSTTDAEANDSAARETPTSNVDPFAAKPTNNTPADTSMAPVALGGWKQLSPSAGGRNSHFERVEIDPANSANVSITPRPNAWYQAYRGGLIYQDVTGDFLATARVQITGRDGSSVPKAQFSMAGWLVRADDSSRQNFASHAMGVTDRPGAWQFQSMNTTNGDSHIDRSNASSGVATLGVARVGGTLLLLVDTGSGWTLQRKYSRPDLPLQLQVGLMAGSDWPACQAAGVEVHNRDGIRGGQPDLTARFTETSVRTLSLSSEDQQRIAALVVGSRPDALFAINAPPARPNPTVPSKSPVRSTTPPPTKPTIPPSTPTVATTPEPVVEWKADAKGFNEIVRPFFNQHCLRCHGPQKQEGDFRIDEQLPNDFVTRSVAEKWSEVLNMLDAGDMPPEDEPRPPAAEIVRVTQWITEQRLLGEQSRQDGQIVLRRLNREEYNNTVRDLIGVNLRAADQFPEDAPAGGFDNIGEALTISPLHLELYIKAAQQLLDRAIVTSPQRPKSIRWRFQLEEGNQGLDRYRVNVDGQRIIVNAGNNKVQNGMVQIWRDGWDRGCGFRAFTVPSAGEYIIRVRAASIVPDEKTARAAGPRFHLQRQEREDAKRTNPQQRQRGRMAFEKYVLPFAQKHFAEDRSYRYGPTRMKIDGTLAGRIRIIDEMDVAAPQNAPQVYETRAWFSPTQAGVAIHNVYHIPRHQYNFWFQEAETFPRPQLLIDWAEIEGPVYDQWPPASHTRLFIDTPNRRKKDVAYARDVLGHFMRRAFRRPLREGELDSKVALFERVRPQKPSFEEAIKTPLIAVLASPHFLYMVEEQPAANEAAADAPAAQPLNNHELATRLSYFLWSSMPDEELFGLAEGGKLSEPQTLTAQVDRMLADPKSDAFVRNFAGQWLKLRDVGTNPPAQKIYPRYDDHLEVSMRRESEEFFRHILHSNLPVQNFVRSDFVTINERLARFYDIPGVKGDNLRVVPVPRGTPRGGLLTQASILSVTSNGTRTSPVDRGVWILENLLGDPPPPPPPNAGDIPPGVPGLDRATVRERLRIHREQPQCARCHNKIDPLGFALENFNAAGEWRTQEASWNRPEPQENDPAIDASAQLPNGTKIVGVVGLQQELLKQSDEFTRCLAGKLHVYALGRPLATADKAMVEETIVATRNQPTLRALIQHIVTSETFRSK